MKVEHLIKILQHVQERSTTVRMDCIDDVTIRYVVVEDWNASGRDIIVTDDYESFIQDNCLEDDDALIYGMERLEVYGYDNGVIKILELEKPM